MFCYIPSKGNFISFVLCIAFHAFWAKHLTSLRVKQAKHTAKDLAEQCCQVWCNSGQNGMVFWNYGWKISSWYLFFHLIISSKICTVHNIFRPKLPCDLPWWTRTVISLLANENTLLVHHYRTIWQPKCICIREPRAPCVDTYSNANPCRVHLSQLSWWRKRDLLPDQ